ncbi:MAG: CapA family protein [Caldicoprobacterales bacterium]|jgi:poly-gamma-glutamate capsule biosynthesis protein CapA/YwtB (metallophosphatase superfamily)|nr:CapA family protein [Clostridiales bacterium]
MKLKAISRKLGTAALILSVFLVLINMLTGCAQERGTGISPAENNTETIPPNQDKNPEIAEPDPNTDILPSTNSKAGTVKQPEVVSVTISAAGDCTLGINYTMSYEDSFDAVYDSKGKSYFFKNVLDILSKDDFSIINLEGPLTSSKDRQSKLYNHRGRPEYVDILTEGSIEAVSFSNNHTYDYGQSGYEDTVELLTNAGIAYACDGIFGMYETKGIKIGFVSVNELYDSRFVEVWLEDGITRLRQQGADLVLACIHWGSSLGGKISHVDDYQIELGNKCIDWGYDLVIGNHAHVLSGINKNKGKYIAYSLGNFCYGGSKNPEDKDSGIFQQTFTFVDGKLQEDNNVRFIPCSISSVNSKNDYRPTIATGKEAKRIISKMNAYSAQYGVAFDSEGNALADTSLTEKNKADAFYSIFEAFFKDSKPNKGVKYIGVDLSLLGLPDTAYLEGRISEWCSSNGYTAFFGSKTELVAAEYNKKAAKGEATIMLFDPPKWSNNQVQCRVLRNITLLPYLEKTYTSAYADGKWITVNDIYIQL